MGDKALSSPPEAAAWVSFGEQTRVIFRECRSARGKSSHAQARAWFRESRGVNGIQQNIGVDENDTCACEHLRESDGLRCRCPSAGFSAGGASLLGILKIAGFQHLLSTISPDIAYKAGN
jgi:hypothetical protein